MKRTVCVVAMLAFSWGACAAETATDATVTPSFLKELTASVFKSVNNASDDALSPVDLLFLMERYVETKDVKLSTLVKAKLGVLMKEMNTRMSEASAERVRLATLFSAAHRVFGEEAYARTAESANASETKTAFAGDEKAPASIDDGLKRVCGLIKAFEHTGNLALRNRAEKTFDRVKQMLAAASNTSLEQAGSAAYAGMRLYYLTGKKRFKTFASELLSARRDEALKNPGQAGKYGLTACAYVVYPFKFVVIGAPEDRQALLDAVLALPLVNRTILPVDPKADPRELARLGYPDLGKPVVFMCTDKTCSAPVTQPERLGKMFQRLANQQ